LKEHLIIKANKSLNNDLPSNVPYWEDFIDDKSVVIDSLFNEFDALFNNYNYKFWVTNEFNSKLNNWGDAEKDAALDRIYRIIYQEDYDIPDDFITKVRALPNLESARPLLIGKTELPTPILSAQSSVTSGKPSDMLFLQYAQLFTKGDAEIKIAVLDTGVNMNHKELQGTLVNPADFVNLKGLDTTNFIGDYLDDDFEPEDDVGHGTHVSGIIAAKGIEMDEGICPDCKIMPVRVLATMKNGNKVVGAGIIDNINAGIKYAVDKGADVINMSLGIKHTGGGLPHEEVIKYALSKNVTIVAASGNDGSSQKYYPGALPGVIAVGAVDSIGNVTNFSSYGADITVVAPGLNIYSSYTRNTYATASGTSQASPFVCGAVGLMKSYAKQQGKHLSNENIKYILKHTSDKVDSHLHNEKAGYGLLNLADAFKLLNHIIH